MSEVSHRVYEQNRWLAQELLKAFTAAKQIAYARLARTVAPSLSLPFIREEYEQTVARMGADYWAYGLAPNRAGLETFCRYAVEQGLADREPGVESLFAPPRPTTTSYLSEVHHDANHRAG